MGKYQEQLIAFSIEKSVLQKNVVINNGEQDAVKIIKKKKNSILVYHFVSHQIKSVKTEIPKSRIMIYLSPSKSSLHAAIDNGAVYISLGAKQLVLRYKKQRGLLTRTN